MKKLSELKRKPKLVELVIKDEDIVNAYGDEIVFHCYDHIELGTYFAFFRDQHAGDMNGLVNTLRTILLDEHGKPVLAADEVLPVDILAAAVREVGALLGKSETPESTPTPGKPQKT